MGSGRAVERRGLIRAYHGVGAKSERRVRAVEEEASGWGTTGAPQEGTGQAYPAGAVEGGRAAREASRHAVWTWWKHRRRVVADGSLGRVEEQIGHRGGHV